MNKKDKVHAALEILLYTLWLIVFSHWCGTAPLTLLCLAWSGITLGNINICCFSSILILTFWQDEINAFAKTQLQICRCLMCKTHANLASLWNYASLTPALAVIIYYLTFIICYFLCFLVSLQSSLHLLHLSLLTAVLHSFFFFTDLYHTFPRDSQLSPFC